MNERIMQFRVGVMVLAAILVAAILILLFGEMPSLVRGTYTIRMQFDEAPGVTRQTPIRKSGIRIGRVTDIEFADNDRAVIVTAQIDANRYIYANEKCRAVSSLLIGDAAIEFSLPPGEKPGAPIRNNETPILGTVAKDPTQAIADMQGGLNKAIQSVNVTSGEMQSVLKRVDGLLTTNEKTITKVIDQSHATLATMQETFNNANQLLGDKRVQQQFKQTMEELPGVLKTMDTTIGKVGDNIGSLEKLMEERIKTTTDNLNRLTNDLLKFSNDLNNSEGTLGQLVHDPELYQHLNRTARNIDELTRQLKPILDDARVFTDKIARHPESLGVRGALQHNPPGIK